MGVPPEYKYASSWIIGKSPDRLKLEGAIFIVLGVLLFIVMIVLASVVGKLFIYMLCPFISIIGAILIGFGCWLIMKSTSSSDPILQNDTGSIDVVSHPLPSNTHQPIEEHFSQPHGFETSNNTAGYGNYHPRQYWNPLSTMHTIPSAPSENN